MRTETFSPRNFVAANLFRADLRKMDFQDSHFDHANLVYAKLDGVLMKRTSLNGASMDFAQINGASLDGADLNGATLGVTKLRNTSLDHADLRGAWLYAAVLDGSFLSGALLQGATLDEASLEGSVLGLAQLQGASLVGTRLQGARLDSASLIGASLNGAQLQGAGLDSADLEGADLEGAKLDGALLDNARLQGAHLDKAELQSASLVAPYVFAASGHANFNGARFEHVITGAVYPVLFKNIVPITQAVVKDWISAATVGVEGGSRKTIIAKRLEFLNDAIKRSVKDNDWSALERSAPSATEYQKGLTNELIILSCDKQSAPYLIEGILRSASPEQFGRVYMTGPYFFIYAQVLRSGRKVATNCPGSNVLTDKDWERLDQRNRPMKAALTRIFGT